MQLIKELKLFLIDRMGQTRIMRSFMGRLNTPMRDVIIIASAGNEDTSFKKRSAVFTNFGN